MAPMQLPSKPVDVVVVGAGPAGMMASLCFNTFGFKVLHVDEREGTTKAGKADGLQPRTLEVFRNIGGINPDITESNDFRFGKHARFAGTNLLDAMYSKGNRVYEVAFWDPSEQAKLVRTARLPGCPGYIDIDYSYVLTLHQGLIEKAFLQEIENRRQYLSAEESVPAPHGGLFYDIEFVSCRTLDASYDSLAEVYPVEVVLRKKALNDQTFTIRSKYLIGCDGSKSNVRRCIAGGEPGDGDWKGKITMQGAVTEEIFVMANIYIDRTLLADSVTMFQGVVDVRVRTDFPDIKSFCYVTSKDSGGLLIIPREGGLVRFYVQLGPDVDRSKQTLDTCIETAKKIMKPFEIDIGYVDWYSNYRVGQKIASSYTLDQRVFLGGDATHNHSPKQGQGMNVSMIDMYSLAWKINLVEKGIGKREVILPTYEQERRAVAQELVDFDAQYAHIFGKSPDMTVDPSTIKLGDSDDSPTLLQLAMKNAAYIVGCGVYYPKNAFNSLPDADIVKGTHGKAFNPAGCKLAVGERMTPGKAIRIEDLSDIDIQHEIKMNGAFRIHIFAGQLENNLQKLVAFGRYIDSEDSFYNRHRPAKDVSASIVDGPANSDTAHAAHASQYKFNPFFTFLTIVATHHHKWELDSMPSPFIFHRSQIYSDCVFDPRLQEAGTYAPLHKKYGINEDTGAIVVVRPDGFVGAVVQFQEEGWLALADYFDAFLIRK